MQKLKRDFGKQVKTGLEEATFDTIKMVQSDMNEVSNQQKQSLQTINDLTNRLQSVSG